MSSAIDRSSEAAAKNKIKKRRNPRKSTQYISLNPRKEASREFDEPTPLSPLSPLAPSSSAPFFPATRKTAQSPKTVQSPSSVKEVKFTFSQTISMPKQSSSDQAAEQEKKLAAKPIAPAPTTTTPDRPPVPPPRRNRRSRLVNMSSESRMSVAPEPIVTHL